RPISTARPAMMSVLRTEKVVSQNTSCPSDVVPSRKRAEGGRLLGTTRRSSGPYGETNDRATSTSTISRNSAPQRNDGLNLNRSLTTGIRLAPQVSFVSCPLPVVGNNGQRTTDNGHYR